MSRIPKTTRHKAYKKWGKHCRFCGTTKNLTLHHMDGNPKHNAIKNLMPI